MAAKVQCTHCQSWLSAQDAEPGKRLRCTQCGRVFRIPKPQSAEGAAEAERAAAALESIASGSSEPSVAGEQLVDMSGTTTQTEPVVSEPIPPEQPPEHVPAAPPPSSPPSPADAHDAAQPSPAPSPPPVPQSRFADTPPSPEAPFAPHEPEPVAIEPSSARRRLWTADQMVSLPPPNFDPPAAAASDTTADSGDLSAHDDELADVAMDEGMAAPSHGRVYTLESPYESSGWRPGLRLRDLPPETWVALPCVVVAILGLIFQPFSVAAVILIAVPGLVVHAIGAFGIVGVALRERTLYGVLTLFITPFAIYYIITRFDRVERQFWRAAAGLGIMILAALVFAAKIAGR